METIVVPHPAEIGRRIKQVRKASMLSQEELASNAWESAALSYLVSRLERGAFKTVDLAHLVRVANGAAGSGMLKETAPEEILDFLQGRSEQLPAQMS